MILGYDEELLKEDDINLYIEQFPINIMAASANWAGNNLNCQLREKQEPYIHNSCGLRELNEANLNRLSRGHSKDGYVVISASKDDYDTAENNKRTADLENRIKHKEYSYLKVFGGYKYPDTGIEATEKSFAVYPFSIRTKQFFSFDKLKEDMIELGKEFEQVSILICPPNEKPRYLQLTTMQEEKPFDSIIYNDANQGCFTALKKWNTDKFNKMQGKPQRYTYTIEKAISELNKEE